MWAGTSGSSLRPRVHWQRTATSPEDGGLSMSMRRSFRKSSWISAFLWTSAPAGVSSPAKAVLGPTLLGTGVFGVSTIPGRDTKPELWAAHWVFGNVHERNGVLRRSDRGVVQDGVVFRQEPWSLGLTGLRLWPGGTAKAGARGHCRPREVECLRNQPPLRHRLEGLNHASRPPSAALHGRQVRKANATGPQRPGEDY